MFRSAARFLSFALLGLVLAACGGGGGDNTTSGFAEKGVFTGVLASFNYDYDRSDGGGTGGGADGGGGVGAGGALGQFRNALVIVKFPDGTVLGQAPTDPVNGMVTIRPGAGYVGGLVIEIHGQANAEYFEEGKNAYVPFPPGRLVRAMVTSLDRNIGVTPFTEAAFQLAVECASRPVPGVCEVIEGSGPLPSVAVAEKANARVKEIVNQQFSTSLQIDDITRLPYIVNDSTPGDAVPASSARGRAGLVNVAVSKQAAMYNTSDPSPTLLAIEQLGQDLRDGVLDGLNHGEPSVAASRRTYDPATFTTELSAALAQQTTRYGKTDAVSLLPRLVGFGNTRYQSYFFDARVVPNGSASTLAVATENPDAPPRNTPETFYVPGSAERRAFAVFGNMGSGSLFIKTDSPNSTSSILALGDNTNGELGSGTREPTSRANPTYTINFPGIVTHMAGGFGHSLARLSNGAVYAWGDNAYGQLGQGTAGGSLPRVVAPARVNLPAEALSVAAGNTSSFALLQDGRVFSWGSNWGFGTLGNGSKDGVRAAPGPVLAAGGELSGVVQLSVRDNDGVVLRDDGSVWTWGSFPATIDTTINNFQPLSNAGGRQVATRVEGLPGTSRVRKVITEQGLFAALMSGGAEDGAVYTWGLYFDITAGRVLVDAAPVRVLNLPPIRDMMPGGFLPYGQRPFDRDTSLAVDYDGNFWRIRGRVAERYDPALPLAQRRPKAQTGRPDCSACHTVRGKTVPAMPVSGAACDVNAIPSDIRSLVTSQSSCESCHNGAPLASGRVLPILNCVKPALGAPAVPERPAALSTTCSLPTTGHVGMSPGTTCATCHNSVIAKPLTCLPRAATFAPPLSITAAITQVLDASGDTVASGGVTRSTAPSVRGTLSTALAPGQTVDILRDSARAGAATLSGSTWSFPDSGLTTGSYSYTARVVGIGGAAFGPLTAPYRVDVDTVAPGQSVRITSLTDNVGGRQGVFPSTSPVTTDDTTPILSGTISAELGAGETLRVFRNGVSVGAASVNGANWTFADSISVNQGYQYDVRVVDAAGNQSRPSEVFSVTLLTGPPTNVGIVVVFAGEVPYQSTPAIVSSPNLTLRLGLGRPLLSAERIELTRRHADGTSSITLQPPRPAPGVAFLDLNDSLLVNGQSYVYSARVVNDAGNVQATPSVFSISCAGCVFLSRTTTISVASDVAPTSGPLADDQVTADTTPTLSGRVSSGPYSGLKVRVSRSGGGADVYEVVDVNTDGQWTFTDNLMPALLSGPYTYTARVESGGEFGPNSAVRRVIVSVLPTFLTSTSFYDDVDVVGNRTSGTPTDDTTPSLILNLSSGATEAQSIRGVIVNGGVETPVELTISPFNSSPLFGRPGPFGTQPNFTLRNPLENNATWTRGQGTDIPINLYRDYVLLAIVTDASGARNQSNPVTVRLQPLCNYTFSSHGVGPPFPANFPTCSGCHTSGGTGAAKGPGRTCRLQ
jgi:hypothetical protein